MYKCEMDFKEATNVVIGKIQKFEPDHAIKIIGYILLQENGEREIVRLAFAPDVMIHYYIRKALAELAIKPVNANPISPSVNRTHISDIPNQFSPYSPASSHPFPSPPTPFRVAPFNWESQLAHEPQQQVLGSEFAPLGYSNSISALQNQAQLMSLEDELEPANHGISGFSSDYYYPEGAFDNLSARANRRIPSLPDFPVKTCHYFNKGFCKHGSNCRYYHGETVPESFAHMFGPNLNDFVDEDQLFSPGSLEKLELEITELLKSRRGSPVSIASLPMIYYEKYGKILQADGYLTESQRHGKAGYSLTKLLARLKNSVRLIDRPHGQHAIVLAEDAPRYMEYRTERNDPGPIVSGSRQIYLTFPAESTFSEEDVADYFNTFGPVEDVRIPCQQKRMFGFVTFVSADTVKTILAKGNPHFVCGARVLVKPYREKSKIVDRKYSDKMDPPMYYPSHYIDMEAELNSIPRGPEASRLFRKHLLEEQEQALELERRRLVGMQLARKPLSHQPYFNYCADGLRVSEDPFSYLLDVFNNESTNGDNSSNLRLTGSNFADQESSQGLDLPESPFASPITSSISTVM